MELDHIVHFVHENPQETTAYWRERGFHAAVGGQHISWGTHNALLYLKDCYIEWLAVEKEEVACHADHPLTRQLLHDQAGFGTVCLRTKNIKGLNDDLRNRGINTSGVLDAERRTEAGQLIKWRMLFIEEAVSARLPYPFFIEWQKTDQERYKKLRDNGIVQASNEKMAIDRCVFGVWNPKEAASKWQTILGGSLELDNCRLEFRKTDHPMERLEEVHFAEGEDKVEFEQGQYWLPLV
ncbi:VOC family protein [Planococcus sp. ISL-110]|uniref:VOC family protein n=1 Tax=Planococcus sp. ISL-110 TaxID=2819167 RepID=UPI001BE54244|nr:VOC family protein [Planococcus sp. ISL-110]MBT2570554.1 VOC family protein [Planococcus sp. ISL-110]